MKLITFSLSLSLSLTLTLSIGMIVGIVLLVVEGLVVGGGTTMKGTEDMVVQGGAVLTMIGGERMVLQSVQSFSFSQDPSLVKMNPPLDQAVSENDEIPCWDK